MAAVTLSPSCAEALRHYLLSGAYTGAAEEVARSMPCGGDFDRLMEAREPLGVIEFALEQIGMESSIESDVNLSIGETRLRQWSRAAFEWEYEKLGHGLPDFDMAPAGDCIAEVEQITAKLRVLAELVTSVEAQLPEQVAA